MPDRTAGPGDGRAAAGCLWLAPSFLKILLDRPDELKLDVSCVKKTLRFRRTFPPSVRDALAARGVQGYQGYATADLGVIAYETPARERVGCRRGVIIEIVRRVPTTRCRLGSRRSRCDKLQSRLSAGPLPVPATCRQCCPASRPADEPICASRVGWDADQTTKIKGYVRPSVAGRRRTAASPEVARARLVVDNAGGQGSHGP